MDEIINDLMDKHEPEHVLAGLAKWSRDFSARMALESNKDAAFYYKILAQKIEEAEKYARGR